MKNDETRTRIIEGSKNIFQLYGFTRVSIDEIAASLKISKKTIYKHFKSKDDLIWGVIESTFEPLAGKVTTAIDSDRAFKETVTELLKVFQTLPSHVTPAMLQDMRNMPRHWEKLDRKRRELITGSFGKLIERGRRDGDVRSDVDPTFMINLILQLVSSMINPRMLMEFNVTPAEYIQKLISILTTGILTDQGKEKLGETK